MAECLVVGTLDGMMEQLAFVECRFFESDSRLEAAVGKDRIPNPANYHETERCKGRKVYGG